MPRVGATLLRAPRARASDGRSAKGSERRAEPAYRIGRARNFIVRSAEKSDMASTAPIVRGMWPNLAATGRIDWPYWGLATASPSTTACQRLPVRRIVVLPFSLFLYPRVIPQASREHHFATGDLSRTDRRCGLRDFAQTLAVAVDHGNHDSPRPSRRCRFSRRCRRCALRRCRYLRNLIPLHCSLPPFGPSQKLTSYPARSY